MSRSRKLQTVSVATVVLVVAGGTLLALNASRTHTDTVGGAVTATALTPKVAADKEASLNALLQAEDKKHRRGNPWGDDLPGWSKRQRRFLDLYIARHERDVVAQMIPFLEDEDENLREQAAQVLGELENPKAEAPLQAKLKQTETHDTRVRAGLKKPSNAADPFLHKERLISPLTLKLALGRIRSRDLKGVPKLDKVAQIIGLSYNEIVQLAQKFGVQTRSENPKIRGEAVKSSAFKILVEFVDIVHDMGRSGDGLQALRANELSVVPGFQMRLQGATMSVDKEIETILDHATSPKGGVFEPLYLLGLGPRAAKMTVQRLDDISRNPDKYNLGKPQSLGSGFVDLFRAAALTGDPEVIPMLERLVKHPDPRVRSYALQTMDAMKDGTLP